MKTSRAVLNHILPELPVKLSDLKSPAFYDDNDKIVFFGHYWLKGTPTLFRGNTCCLDYSVAKQGKLVAYRLDEETVLDDRKVVYV